MFNHVHRRRPLFRGGGMAVAVMMFAALVQTPDKAIAGDYLMDVWSADTGLPSSSVTAIAQTPDGYLWVGTQNGLARFDGVRFVNYEPRNTSALKHGRVNALFVDSQGTLWINTYDGSLTSWRDGNFTHEWQGKSKTSISAIFERTNELFFAEVSGGLVSRKGNPNTPGQWTRFEPTQRTTGMSYREDCSGALWYGTRNGQVERLKGTNAETFFGEDGLEGQTNNYLTSDCDRQIWVGTDKEIAMWNGERFVNQTPTNGESPLAVSFMLCTRDGGCWVLANGRLRKCVNRQWVKEAQSWGAIFGNPTFMLQAYEDRQGGVWFCHFGQGIFHVKPDGSMSRISSADGLPGDRITCWFQDREGGVWVGVDRGGLVHLREKRVQVIGPGEGLPARAVTSVCEDRAAAIWLGTSGGGLNRWQNGRLTTSALSEGSSAKFFHSVVPDGQGRLWLSAGREDLFILEEGKIQKALWPVHGIKVMLFDHQERLWIGTSTGLACVSGGVLTNLCEGNGLDFTDIHALAEDRKGNIWIGGGNGTLYQFAEGKFTPHRTGDSLAGEAIWSLSPDADGTLWVGTFQGGLLRFKNGKFTRYTTADGLPGDTICQILDDEKGNLWIGSLKGIFHLPKNALNDFAGDKRTLLPCVAYGLDDGLPTLECSGGYQPAAWRDHGGRLWFATLKGAVVISPNETNASPAPAPAALLEDVLVDGKSFYAARNSTNSNLAESSAKKRNTIEIPPGGQQFEFRYTAPSFVAPDKVGFRYQLDGLDSKPVEAGERRSAQYPHLPAGDYRFHVVACNEQGVWSEMAASVTLKVLPHFWETWWFRSSLAVALVGGLVGMVRVVATRKLQRKLERLEQQRAVEHERARIARDIHDDLGAGLTQIMLQSALARHDPQNTVQNHLGQISHRAGELIQGMDEIVWAINPQNDTLESLVIYLSKHTQEFLMIAGIRCRLDMPDMIPAHRLSPDVRHNVFLAIKETLNNVVKHAHASEVQLKLMLEPAQMTFQIVDDGGGFNPDEISKVPTAGRTASGNGLNNMIRRMESVGGNCFIRSRPNHGTTIEMTVHLETAHSHKKVSDIITG